MDGFVYVLDSGLNKQQTINLVSLSSMIPKPRSACEGSDGKVLIGTRGGEIYEV